MAMVMERGLLMRNPLQMLTLRLNHGTMEDMDGHTMVATTATEKGLLMLNPHPMLMPRQPWYGWGYGWPHYGGYWYGKRSADAEPAPNADAKAEPWYGWGYGWPHYGGYWYGKRSADSEPAPN